MNNTSRDQSGAPPARDPNTVRARRPYETPLIDTYNEQEYQAEFETTHPPSKPASGS
jgi:hypothetical protein